MMRDHILEEEHFMFRESFRRFVQEEIVRYHAQWEKDGQVSREVWQKAGENGFLCMDVPEEYGGTNEIMKEIIGRAIMKG